jgi:hypothetical protein
MPPRAHTPEGAARTFERRARERETAATVLAESSAASSETGDDAVALRLLASARRQRVLAMLDRARAGALRAVSWPPWSRG